MAETGKVKFYNWKKGFGFVTSDAGEDLFLHRTGVPKGIKLFTGDEVEFDIIDGPKGKNATNIKVTKSVGPAPMEGGFQKKEEQEEQYEDSEDFEADK